MIALQERSGKIALALIATALTLAPLVRAQSPGRLTPEVALTLNEVQEVAVSPDGATILYAAERAGTAGERTSKRVSELWMVASRGGAPLRLEAGFNAHAAQWSPDGRRLAWIAQQDVASAAQLRVVSAPEAGAQIGAAAITDSSGEVVALRWAPSGNRIAYTSQVRIVAPDRRDSPADQDWIVFGVPTTQLTLSLLDVRTGVAKALTHGELSVYDFDWSPDGTQIVFGATPTPSADDFELRMRPYVVSVAGGEPRLIADTVGRLSNPVWSRDGRWIAWLASTDVTDPWPGSVFVVPAAGGAKPLNLSDGYAGTPVWLGSLPGRRATLVFLAEEGEYTALRTVDLDTRRQTLLSAPLQIMSAVSFRADGKAFAAVADAPSHPAEVFAGTSGTSALRRLTDSNPALRDLAFGEQKSVRWRSRDGLEIGGVLVKPVGFRSGVRYPVVVHVHGGSESVSSNGWLAHYQNWGQLLAARGYLTIYPNYRGSRGRGVQFVRGNRHDLMGREWEDIEGALDHVVELGLADNERAGIYGFSWGGYAAGWGATFASHRFKAAVAGDGIYDWISEAGSNDTRMHEQRAHWGSPLYQDFQLYLDRSPIYHVRTAATPLLMLHGEEDEACPLTQALEMYTALKWKGVPTELVIYPREGHGARELPHQRDFVNRGLAWLDRYLQPR